MTRKMKNSFFVIQDELTLQYKTAVRKHSRKNGYFLYVLELKCLLGFETDRTTGLIFCWLFFTALLITVSFGIVDI